MTTTSRPSGRQPSYGGISRPLGGRSDFEYIVVGLGGIGSATAYHLARRAGGDVLGLEQFELGHYRGASQDHSRIVRLSYHSPGYVRLAQHAFAAWAELERDYGSRLLVETGGLDLWPANSPENIGDYHTSLESCGVEHELLDPTEVMRRWPAWRVPPDVVGLYQANAGIAPAARCNAAHVELARSHGATLIEHSPVTTVQQVDGEIEVESGGRHLRCRRLVVAADAWTNEVLGRLGVSLPLRVTQEQVTYFAAPAEQFAPERFPIWIWQGDPCFYGVPIFGEPGIKIGQDVGGREVTPKTRTFDVDEPALSRVTSFLGRHLPSALGPRLYTKTCLYTMAPDRDFIVDSVSGCPGAFVVQGAAHGFKFASLLGKILAELAIDGATEHDIRAFRIDRDALLVAAGGG